MEYLPCPRVATVLNLRVRPDAAGIDATAAWLAEAFEGQPISWYGGERLRHVYQMSAGCAHWIMSQAGVGPYADRYQAPAAPPVPPAGPNQGGSRGRADDVEASPPTAPVAAVPPAAPAPASPADELNAFALWLSCTWIVDGVFDSWRSREMVHITKADLERMKAVYSYADREQKGVVDPVSPVMGHWMMEKLLRVIRHQHERFRELTEGLRAKSPLQFYNFKRWGVQYTETLLDGQNNVLKDGYVQWRLRSGAMMCVGYYLALCLGGGWTTTMRGSWEEGTAAATALYNDILSLDRDIRRETPNYVIYSQEEPVPSGAELSESGRLRSPRSTPARNEPSLMNAMASTAALVDTFIEDTAAAFEAERAANLARGDPVQAWLQTRVYCGVMYGTIAWHQQEPRYQVGREMLTAALKHDLAQFNALFEQQAPTPGDPQTPH